MKGTLFETLHQHQKDAIFNYESQETKWRLTAEPQTAPLRSALIFTRIVGG